MPKDIIIISTYLRAEYLYLCLEHLANTERTASEKEFWVVEDRRENDEHRYKMIFEWCNEVIAAWNGPLKIRKFTQKPHNFVGNSFNVMQAYNWAYQSDARFVYLVEDDVLVKPDFFRWHEAIQEAEPKTMCSIAYRCSRNHEARADVTDPAAYFTTARDYASIGVCWRRENLGPLVEHNKLAYFSDLDGYIGRTFPGNRFVTDFCEQDGLAMRVAWTVRGFTTWPYVPRAYHMGWYSYHRPNGKVPNGFWQQKVGQIRAMISDPEALKIAAPDYGDIEPYPAAPTPPWAPPLVKLQEFD